MQHCGPSAAPRHRRTAWRLWLGTALLGAIATGAFVARAADPDALWKIVHGRCVPNAQAGNPAPCVQVDADDAVLKDIVGATQFLLIPTARITGIESPALLEPAAPNFFAAAWQARHYVDQVVGHALARDAFALAINPPSARSQNQLHIHVDCIRPDVRAALQALPIGEAWAMLPQPLAGQRYAAIRLPGDVLDRNPFDVLANEMPGAREAMGSYTLVLVGSGDGGFILLAGRVGADGAGHGEDIEDHRCTLAAAQP